MRKALRKPQVQSENHKRQHEAIVWQATLEANFVLSVVQILRCMGNECVNPASGNASN